MRSSTPRRSSTRCSLATRTAMCDASSKSDQTVALGGCGSGRRSYTCVFVYRGPNFDVPTLGVHLWGPALGVQLWGLTLGSSFGGPALGSNFGFQLWVPTLGVVRLSGIRRGGQAMGG
eukprot:358248-Chlamydomonas_euryale.AAC.1